jgi:hypothetical protein
MFAQLYSLQTEIHPTSYPIGLSVERPGRKADHSPPFNVEVKNGGAIPPLPHTPSWLGVS